MAITPRTALLSSVHSTTIAVSDQDAALAFWVDQIGWRKEIDAPMGPEMRFVTVGPPDGGTQLALGHVSWAAEIATLGGPTGIAISTHDIDAAYATLAARGVRFKGPVEMMPWGSRAAWFYDQDDNEFFLAEG